jgi:hypothetical protein
MDTIEPIEKKYEKAFHQANAANPVFPYQAKQQMAKLVEEIAASNNTVQEILSTEQPFFVKGGNAAEEWHAHSFNLDAILQDNDARAYTDRRGGWYEHDFQGAPLKRNDNPDIVVVKDGEVSQSAQLKYNKDAASTAGQMSQMGEDGQPKYAQNDSFIGPSDQKEAIRIQSQENIDKNLARNGDPARREAYKQTKEKISDTLTDDKVSSKPLTKQEADDIGQGKNDKFEQLEQDYQSKSTMRQMGQAAVGAAAMSAVVSGSINTVRYIQMARDGQISSAEATQKIVVETIASAADSALKASANAGVQSLMVRYGAEQAVIASLAKQGLGAMMRTNAVTVGVVCAIDAVKDLVRLGTGAISADEFYERQGKNVLTTSAGVMGGMAGSCAAASMAASIGLSATAAGTVLTIAGGLAGGMIAGMALSLAIENGIEKPYRDLVQNTTYLQEAARELERVSRTVLAGQAFFSKYLEADLRLENRIQRQFDKIDAAGIEALEIIGKI